MEAEAQEMPSRLKIESAKKQLKAAHQELMRVQSARETRAATLRMVRAQLQQRLATIAEREEARKVQAIRHRIAPEFRVPTSSGR